jgi:hypothetical protein
MSNFRDYVKRHHVGLVALLLVLTGGTAYAATAIPKNAVGSKQVKDNSLRGKDLKDAGLTGADLADGSVGGADLADGGIGAGDLAASSVDGSKVKDGSIGNADLAPGTVPQIQTLTKVAAADSAYHPYATFPGLGAIEFWCDPTAASVRIIGPGGVEIYSYAEVASLSGDEVQTNAGKASNMFIRQVSATGTAVSGRIVAHSATQSLDVDVRVSHQGGCTITGTATITSNVTGTVPG